MEDSHRFITIPKKNQAVSFLCNSEVRMLCWLSVGVRTTQTWVRSLALPLQTSLDKLLRPYLSLNAPSVKGRKEQYLFHGGQYQGLNEIVHWKLLPQGLAQGKHSAAVAGFVMIAIVCQVCCFEKCNSFPQQQMVSSNSIQMNQSFEFSS